MTCSNVPNAFLMLTAIVQELIIPDMSSDEMLEYNSSSDQDTLHEPETAASEENVVLDWKGDPMSKRLVPRDNTCSVANHC